MATTYWTGTTSHDFYLNSNWSANASVANYHDINITGISACSPALAVACTPSSIVIPSLTIGDYGTLDITARSCGSSETSPVFSSTSFQVFQGGSIVVNTPSAVDLGSINELGGTLTIENNQGNVYFNPSDRLTGTGTVNLVNSTLGSQTHQINVADSLTLNLKGHSSVFTGFDATGATVNFDPSAHEKFFLDGQDTPISTAFNNVSAKTEFGITANTGATPLSAAYTKNSDGTYSLVVQESGNHTLTLSDVTFASGYVPGKLQITQDKAGDYLITPASTTGGGTGGQGGCGGWGGWGGQGGWGCGWGGQGGWGDSGWGGQGGWGCGQGGWGGQGGWDCGSWGGQGGWGSSCGTNNGNWGQLAGNNGCFGGNNGGWGGQWGAGSSTCGNAGPGWGADPHGSFPGCGAPPVIPTHNGPGFGC
ncbi:hypothetical protein [Acidomonas methanolica]|uniref:Uncharacterized protein n=1 Tax=Acidomonas methanolica NBRC 104435 TaxID=1231351 RepID=A0A023D8V0_ACIMT|nr:hypothetical protein [Acidomonas methanolica]MBU2655405.1 hypothetical protein [Acidomonas methanolica]TCS23488.1 hypothetical protein EDC31_13018 [Acidomonas methanolica]GAJ30549.1 hypothetical protein Amme_172_018 [Acidomonas methanolica NBRC 104435]GBQ57369.1 hypothetical protein AA0498_2504 [Acidomonas methanolica]GEL00290.1 hypothetical protein AME01nite_27880 [Acidomonas methanolica NBRC 104435]